MLNTFTTHENFAKCNSFQVICTKLHFLYSIFSNGGNVFWLAAISDITFVVDIPKMLYTSFIEFCSVFSDEKIFEIFNIKKRQKTAKRAITLITVKDFFSEYDHR